ncbi:hypothetical protein SUGI_0218140 [Cryptomeria japonica]|nr:hypothetical protein SUGI_0218140 [Cryptomeria japonica]
MDGISIKFADNSCSERGKNSSLPSAPTPTDRTLNLLTTVAVKEEKVQVYLLPQLQQIGPLNKGCLACCQKLKSLGKAKDNLSKVVWHAINNYRVWILALTYGYCFGVELTIDNVIAQYYFDRFDLNLHTGGIIASTFGLANLVTRPFWGVLSDIVARGYGMRGRIWALWIVQTLGGVFCVWLGKANSLNLSTTDMLIFSMFVQASFSLTFGIPSSFCM